MYTRKLTRVLTLTYSHTLTYPHTHTHPHTHPRTSTHTPTHSHITHTVLSSAPREADSDIAPPPSYYFPSQQQRLSFDRNLLLLEGHSPTPSPGDHVENKHTPALPSAPLLPRWY